jgi:hypothetical protein
VRMSKKYPWRLVSARDIFVFIFSGTICRSCFLTSIIYCVVLFKPSALSICYKLVTFANGTIKSTYKTR